jgi:hypothetical protein
MRDIQNHFSGVANQYAAFRPTYPRQLLADLATLAGGVHTVALDVAAGNGKPPLCSQIMSIMSMLATWH